jgi:hypothetical protein
MLPGPIDHYKRAAGAAEACSTLAVTAGNALSSDVFQGSSYPASLRNNGTRASMKPA